MRSPALSLALLACTLPLFAATDGDLVKTVREPVIVPKFSASPAIDGKVEAEEWKQAGILRDLIQTDPGDHVPASQRTEVLLGYDEHFLYVAFKCWDEKDKIRSSVVQRDRLGNDDNVGFWLDTYDDQRRAYAFAFNPLGIQQDGVQTEGQGTDYNVDVVFESKGVVEDWGWSVEVKIPFKSLRYAAGKGKYWGFNAARNITRGNGEFDSWVPLPRGVPGFLNKFGKITGLDDIKTEHTLEIIPTFTAKETGERATLTQFNNPPIKADFGFTAKYSISPNVTLDAAYNPDFADTEADAPVVRANQRFPIYFSEKRPFFLEGVDIFKTPIEAVYTRRIENPDVALKLTGKIGRTSFGVLGAMDDPLYNPNNKRAYSGILRVKRDVGKESNVGFLGTTYSFGNKQSHLGGFDTSWKINAKSNLRAQVLFSSTRDYFYDADKDPSTFGTGNGFKYSYYYSFTRDRHVSWGFSGGGTSDKFRAALGFVSRTGRFSNSAEFNYNFEPTPKGFITYKYFGVSLYQGHDMHGRLQNVGGDWYGGISFKGNASLGGGFSMEKNAIYEDEFGTKRNAVRPGAFFGAPSRSVVGWGPNAYFYKQFNKRISVNANVSVYYNSFDYDFGAGPDYPRVSPAALALGQGAPLDPGAATSFYFGAGTSLKPTDKFSLGLSYNHSSLRRDDTGLVTYVSNYFSFSSAYQFSRFVNLKARVYYDTLSDNIFGQYTFGWTPSVGKALYIGYNSSTNYNGYAFGARQPGFLQMDRTFFIKLSYLFRKSF
ncbi:MAG: hypothetical protein JO053_10905 [Acidobacteria bacterium]|nr:hypothetical protein [Acidobacteriota bacterium]